MTEKETTGLPPLIDRELIFGDPEIAGANLSPDGRYIAFLKPWKGTRNVYLKAIDEPFEKARLLTAETRRPVAGYFWTWDSKFILYIKDNDGDENYNIYAVDVDAKPDPNAEVVAPKDLTGLQDAHVLVYELPKSEPDIVYLGLNDRDKAWHDLYRLEISSGKRILLRKNSERITSWTFDLKGQLRLALRSAENGDTEILRVEKERFSKVYSCTVFEYCWPLQFHRDAERVYLVTNKDSNLASLVLFNPATGQVEAVDSDPLGQVDFGGALFSNLNEELVETWYFHERVKNYYRDKVYEDDNDWIGRQFPGRDLAVVSRSLDERFWLVNVMGDTEPGATLLFDRQTRSLKPQYKIQEALARHDLAEMKSVRYTSSDGLEIPAYLTLPKGLPGKYLPALLMPHGGPWARDLWGFHQMAQFFANRGYAVLMPNFRGSAGYGRKFLDAGNLEWGAKMQDDVSYGVRYLIETGIADPKRIGILGRSYGGFVTLAGVAFTPELYAAAVDIVGPSNLVTLLETIPPYWESGRRAEALRIGDLETPEGLALLKARSPLNSADKIKTPLLVAQGANDPRVRRAEAEQIVIALRDRGFPVEYLLAPDEGHWFFRPANRLALYMMAERFLAKHLGGRYQEGGSVESMRRLKEITVDPKMVVLGQS